MRKYYAITINYSTVDCKKNRILKIYCSKREAYKEFQDIKPFYKYMSFEPNYDRVYEDSDTCYDIGHVEFYDKYHLKVMIQEVPEELLLWA